MAVRRPIRTVTNRIKSHISRSVRISCMGIRVVRISWLRSCAATNRFNHCIAPRISDKSANRNPITITYTVSLDVSQNSAQGINVNSGIYTIWPSCWSKSLVGKIWIILPYISKQRRYLYRRNRCSIRNLRIDHDPTALQSQRINADTGFPST